MEVFKVDEEQEYVQKKIAEFVTDNPGLFIADIDMDAVFNGCGGRRAYSIQRHQRQSG